MERDNFIYISHCELAIVSHEISLDFIAEELNIVPERTFRKGDNPFLNIQVTLLLSLIICGQ